MTSSSGVTVYGSDETATTLVGGAPTVTNIHFEGYYGSESSQLVGFTLAPNGYRTTLTVDYGTTPALGMSSSDLDPRGFNGGTDGSGDHEILLNGLDLCTYYYYYYSVVATNQAGTATASGPETISTIYDPPCFDPPSPPTNVTAVAGNGLATISFIPVVQLQLVGGFIITASPGGMTDIIDGPPSPPSVQFSGLTNGTSYTFTVSAAKEGVGSYGPTGCFGLGPASVPSNPVTPTAPAANAPLATSTTSKSGNGSSTSSGSDASSSGGASPGNPSNSTGASPATTTTTTTIATSVPLSSIPATSFANSLVPSLVLAPVKAVMLNTATPLLHIATTLAASSALQITLVNSKNQPVAHWSASAHSGTATLALPVPSKARKAGTYLLRVTTTVKGKTSTKSVPVTLRV